MSSHQELDHLFWKDEILQVMYWLHGEGLASDVAIERLASLLGTDAETIGDHVDMMVVDRYLSRSGEKITLTSVGIKEGGARFATAFQGLQKAGHGECGPDCDCQWEGKDTCEHLHLH